MATSNLSGFDYATKSWFWNGNKVTADRYRYELSRQQEITIKQVNDLITRQAGDVVAPAANFSQQEFGGLLRTVVPNLLDQYGKINATAAIQFYDQSRDYWAKELSNTSQGGRDAQRTAGQRFAIARTQGALQAAQGYAAQFADTYDTIAKTDTVVNWAMKVRAKSGHQPSVEAMQNALTREVAAYHRDTVLFNSALDPYVNRVQRVAQASACEFCRLMALGSTNGKVRVSTYAAKFHSHCHCTIQPLFEGEKPVRPDYYDKFEKEYSEASKSGGSAKTILQNMRNNAKKATVAKTPVNAPKASVATKTASKVPVAPVGPYNASQVVSRTIDPRALDVWHWQKGFQATAEVDRQTANKLSREILLKNAKQDLPILSKPATIEEALNGTNPRFSEGRLYKNNCARVVQAYELRRRGFDVFPNGFVDDSSQVRFFYYQGWVNPKTNTSAWDDRIGLPKGIRKVKRAEETAKLILQNHPEGARGMLSFYYDTGNSGHTFNWEIVNGKVEWLDAQSAKTGDWVAEFFTRAKDIDFVRLDDKEPTAQVLRYLEGDKFE